MDLRQINHTRNNDATLCGFPLRSERLFSKLDGFYYRTRENLISGPFPTKSQALYDLNSFVEAAIVEQQLFEECNLELVQG